MQSDAISWLFFQRMNDSIEIDNRLHLKIPQDAKISIASSLFTFKIVSLNESVTENSFTENESPIVVIDEVYRPGEGVYVRKDFYGIWGEDIKTKYMEMFSIFQNLITYGFNDLSISSQHKTHPNLKYNLLITNNEKWERRKDLTGVVLKTVTNAVSLNEFHFCIKFL